MKMLDVESSFEPWCDGCPNLDLEVERMFRDNRLSTAVLTCGHIAICRQAVKSALRPLAELGTPVKMAEPVRPKTGMDYIREMGVEEFVELFLQDCVCPPPMATASCDGSCTCRLCWIRYLENPEGTVMPNARSS